jgi:uncharacterized RDD family membrane protein YckC
LTPDPKTTTGPQFERYLLTTISLPVVLYWVLTEGSSWQATVGKRLLGIRVSRNGPNVGIARAFIRSAVKFLPFELGHLAFALPTPIWRAGAGEFRVGFLASALLLAGNVLLVAFESDRRAIHDWLARTAVVDREP